MENVGQYIGQYRNYLISIAVLGSAHIASSISADAGRAIRSYAGYFLKITDEQPVKAIRGLASWVVEEAFKVFKGNPPKIEEVEKVRKCFSGMCI